VIILARHGQTLWNKEKRLQGWQNSPLSDIGVVQAERVAQQIAKIIENNEVKLISSPLGRAFDTAKIIASELAIKESNINTSPLLKEFCFGIWEGLTPQEIKEKYLEQWNKRTADKWNYIIPRGESYHLVAKRAEQWLENESDTNNIIAISHEGIARVIRGIYLGLNEQKTMSLRQENNHIVILENNIEKIITV
jgi:probable phosphoglycerate mutase